MNPAGPRDVRLVRGAAKPAGVRQVMSKADVMTAVRLTASLAIAWFQPQSWWPFWARRTSWLGGVLAGKTTTAVAARISRALAAPDGVLGARFAADLRGARYEVAFQCLRGYRPGGWRPKIEVRGRERLDDALRAGNGCVLWVAHFVFATNVAKVGLHELGYRVSHLSRPDHGFSSTRFGIRLLNPLRTAFEDDYLAGRIVFDRASPAPALLRARKVVAKNEIVSFTAGAWEGSTVVEAGFLGSRITLAMGPVWLARTSGAVLLPVFAVRAAQPNAFVVEIGEAIDVGDASTEEDAMVEAARRFLLQLEPRVLAQPGQWRGWSSLRDDQPTGA